MAVFIVASAFAAACGATSLRAVSNRTHTINADARYQRRKLHADYDAFWIERGGAPTDWGFKIPLDAPTPHRACRNEQRVQIASLVNRLLQSETIKVSSADGVRPLPDAAPTRGVLQSRVRDTHIAVSLDEGKTDIDTLTSGRRKA